MKSLLWTCLLLAGTSGLLGQQTPQDSIIDLEEVVLKLENDTASPLGLTPSEVLTPQAIRLQNPVDFAGTLNQVPGLYMLSGALNTNRITIRGVGARTPYGTDKLRMYYNDIPVTNGTGSSTLEAFDLENMHSLRVVKGPKSGAYGAALGGALLLQTDQAGPRGTSMRNRSTVGSYGMFKTNLGLEHRDSTLSAEVRYNHLTTQGYRQNNAFDRDGFLFGTQVSLSDNHSLEVLANYIECRAEIPSSISRTAFEEDPTQAAFTWAQAKGYEDNKYSLLGLANRLDLGGGLENTTSVFFSYLDHYEPRPFNILDEFTLGYGLRSIFRLQWDTPGGQALATWGGELYQDQYTWSTYENLYQQNNGNGSLQGDRLSRNKEFRNQYFVFGNLRWPLTQRLSVQAGLSVNHTRYDYRDLQGAGAEDQSGLRAFDPIWLPSLDLRYDGKNGSFLYLNASRGFSNPSLEESLNPDGVVNPEIAQENGMNYELGGHLEALDGRLSLAAALYQMDIRDLLVAQRVGEDQYIGRNAGRTRHRGLELSGEYRFYWRGWVVAPYASYTLSAHRFREFVDGDDDYSGNPLTGVPKNRVYAGLRVQGTSGLYWNTTYQYVDAIPLRDDASIYSDAYQLVSMQWGYRHSVSRRFTAGLQLGVNNLLNTRYASSVLINAGSFGGAEPRYFYPGNARNYYVGAVLSYTL
ncbi:TonB-dependent receptor [Robiginitalea sp. M366]|uniref:TonB-dependent receptor domain-containing protein n=1 Tax=Robiginitalea aestuariiviva TaxID=3036903 RepID=UPI00240E0486|nr:TonB-dependent receptor [Robiginitalea aestuariiviva]MDG1571684.1 TonB-dependent receptor [Robiginitalea aestuariiviva]